MTIGVITADIINSTQNHDWQDFITPQLNKLGTSPKDWNIYRGDSIQLRIDNPDEILEVALMLKSAIKQHKNCDIRMTLGIGKERLRSSKVTLNSGEAYEYSGRLLEEISQNIEIKTAWQELDLGLNAGLNMLNALAEQWTPNSAKAINYRLNKPDLNQNELAKILETTQSNVSRVLSRGHWREIQQYSVYFKSLIKSKL